MHAAFGEAAAVRVHRYVSVDEDAVLLAVPVLLHERAAFASPAVAQVLQPVEGDDGKTLVGIEHVDVVAGQIGFGPQLAAHDDLPGVFHVGELLLGAVVGVPERGGVHEHRFGGKVSGSFGGGQHEGVCAVERYVHVVDRQRLTHRPAGEVLLHGERLAEHGVGVARGVGARVDGDPAQHLPSVPVGMEIVVGPGGVGDGTEVGVGAVVDVAGAPVRAGVGHPDGGPAPRRVRRRGPRRPRQPVAVVIGQHGVAHTGGDGRHGGHDLVADDGRRVGEPGDCGDPQRSLDVVSRHRRTADAVDVAGL